uniref:FFD domain-containing protein n=1 Tax=Trichobilharzia regenti TaxID=157069 RepID=A0AA85KC26_TRIRE|nr:unnamed protein product [Trichobilharzia regenti]
MNTSDLALIGCRVSIISKAKIRYEGNLHSIDFDTPNEPVITLSKVWSFGTEDRPCERPVAPRNEEYNQVVFRGRDLDDVRVVHSSVFLNEDSAIVSAAPGSTLSHPPGIQSSSSRGRGDLTSNRATTGRPEVPPATPPQSFSLDSLNQDNSPSSSNYHPPVVGSRPGPVGTVHTEKSHSDNRGPRPFGDGRSDIDPSMFGRTDTTAKNMSESGSSSGRQRHVPGSGHHDYSHAWTGRDHAVRKGDTYRNASSYNQGHDYSRDRRGGFHQQYASNHRGSRGSGHYGGWSGRSGGGHEWTKYRTNSHATSGEATNFSGEYDYERANAELAAELEKITINTKTGSSNASADNTDNDGSSAAGDENTCYDKSKSFFDTISSEMMDRANGVNPQGMNRRDERLLNSTTFGTVPQMYVRRTGYNNQRSFGYGHRRGNASSGNFWRSSGTGHNKTIFTNSPHTPLPTSGRAG